FFESGGDSILALQLIAKARRLGFDLSVRDLFKAPRIIELASRARRLRPRWGTEPRPDAPLTPIQAWFFDQVGEVDHYNQSMLIRVPAGLDRERLDQAMRRIVAAHDAMRLRFQNGRQILQGPEAFVNQELVRRIDCRFLTSEERRALLLTEGEKAQQSLDIEKGELFRCLWFDYGDEPGRLLWVIHHLAVDGVSWRILIPDLQAACEEKPLPEATTAWTAWAARLPEVVSRRIGELPFWREMVQTSGFQLTDAPSQKRPHDSAFTLELNAEQTRRLLTAAPAAYHANPEDLLLASLCLGLERWTGNSLAGGVLINLEGHGREELMANADLSRTVGWFTAQYPVRLSTAGPLRDTLIGIKETLRAVPGRGVCYVLLRYGGQEELACEPQVSFNYLGRFTNLEGSADWSLADEAHGEPVSPAWRHTALLDINALVAGDRLQYQLTWPSLVFDHNEMARLQAAIHGALLEVLDHCRDASPTFTPSDFPLVQPSREVLDALQKRYPKLQNLLPLTPLQQGLLFHSLEAKGAYQVQLRFRLEGAFDPQRFRKAWQKVIDRHDLLRLAVPEGETDFFVVSGKAELPCRIEDWRDKEDAETGIREYLQADREQGFDLGRAPLLRLALFRVADAAWEVVLNNHHITLDGWSLSVTLGEVLSLYHGEEPPPALPFADYAEWLREKDTAVSLAWWQGALAGFDRPNHIDLPAGKGGEGFGETVLHLDSELSHHLQRAARDLKTTPGILLQTVWGNLVSRITGDSDVVFGNVVSGRPAEVPGIERMVGLFINTVPVRIETQDKSFKELVAELTEVQGERQEHEFTPLYRIQGQAPIAKGASLFETLFVYENYPLDARLQENATGEFTVTASQGIEAPHYPFTLAVLPGGEPTLRLTHDRARADERTAKKLLAWFGHLLEQALAQPEKALAELPLLGEEERHQVLESFNATDAPYPADKTLHRLFEEQAARTPGHAAVRDSEETWTYHTLNQRANRIAHALIEQGVRP
ncbi:MAG: hypothetical protein GX835_03420, partial [Desulfobulbaceae bacterium]|nr:hypothetical protein [Desulfobulbaceae bacterium]